MLFICNQPLREGVDRPHLADAKALREIGIGTIAIMPNDTETYPEDSFDNMKATILGRSANQGWAVIQSLASFSEVNFPK